MSDSAVLQDLFDVTVYPGIGAWELDPSWEGCD